MMVYRMLVAADTFSERALEQLREHDMPNAWIYENTSFVGQGSGKATRLCDEAQMLALDLLAEGRSAQKSINKTAVAHDYCYPIRVDESWIDKETNTNPLFSGATGFLECNLFSSHNVVA